MDNVLKPIALCLGQYKQTLGRISQWKVFSFPFFSFVSGNRFSLPRSFDLCFLFIFWKQECWEISPRGNSGESSKRRKCPELTHEPVMVGYGVMDIGHLFCQETEGLPCFSSQDLEIQRIS